MAGAEIRQVELAEIACTSPPTALRAMRGELRNCLTPDRRRIYRDHPMVQAWIARRRAKHHAKSAARKPSGLPSFAGDPFAFAAAAAAPPIVSGPPLPALVVADDPQAPPVSSSTDGMLEELRAGSQGKIPPIADFRHVPFDEVLDKYGTLEGLMLAVKANKGYVDLRVREQEAAVKRGDLIPRRIVTTVLVPIIDLAFSRLVGEAPTALREQVVARVNSGGTDLAIDVEELIRNEVSGILTDAKSALQAEFERLDLA